MINNDNSGEEPAAAKAPIVKAPPKSGRSMFDNGALQDSDDDALISVLFGSKCFVPAPKAAAAKKASEPKKSKGGLFDASETELEVAESEEEKPAPKAAAGSDGMKNALVATLAKRVGVKNEDDDDYNAPAPVFKVTAKVAAPAQSKDTLTTPPLPSVFSVKNLKVPIALASILYLFTGVKKVTFGLSPPAEFCKINPFVDPVFKIRFPLNVALDPVIEPAKQAAPEELINDCP